MGICHVEHPAAASSKVFLWGPLGSDLTGGNHRQIDPVNNNQAYVCVCVYVCMCCQIMVFLNLEV